MKTIYNRCIKIMLIALSLISLYGCPIKVKQKVFKGNSFVRCYFELNKLSFSQISDNKELALLHYNIKDMDVLYYVKSKQAAHVSKYKALCAKHHDLNFKHTYTSYPKNYYESYSGEIIAYDFKKVDILCKSDYDDEHLSGTPLNDIVTFYSTSLYPFIESGYKSLAAKSDILEDIILEKFYPKAYGHSNEHYYSFETGGFPNHPISKKVADLEQKDLIMIGSMYSYLLPNFAVLKFDKKPKNPGTYTIEVIFTKEDGTTLVTTGIMIFY